MCCTRPPHVPVARIFKISRYTYRCNALLLANKFGFARDSPGTQLNLSFVMCPGNYMRCTRPPHVSVATIFEILRHICRSNALLIRLLKILRQPTTGLALVGAHQIGAIPEFPSTLC
ncbi:hypothetical protein CSKR_113587 [Clonorchis sinensis]|uniref:Uncharacterized protein n=1 Tax=Clonorchis sinensis TaxID=79923 RepID=A0A419Q6J7_CLOSI|nr:hypothetical protein CSKR_113587 [Clonorchis sinensis]